jgi:hypothetical protein
MCSAQTHKGKQCQREGSHKAGANPKYCYQHQPKSQHQSMSKQSTITTTTVKQKSPLKSRSTQLIFKKIVDSKLDETCLARVKSKLWNNILPHIVLPPPQFGMNRTKFNVFQDQVLDRFELYVKTLRDNYIKEIEDKGNIYIEEYLAKVWDGKMYDKNGFDEWLIDEIGNWMNNPWYMSYKDNSEDQIGEAYIESITTAFKICYH